jgi:hypothetical protein
MCVWIGSLFCVVCVCVCVCVYVCTIVCYSLQLLAESLLVCVVWRGVTQSQITESVPVIFEALFQCTLDMITQNYTDFPDHRIKFFTLLRAINAKSFQV